LFDIGWTEMMVVAIIAILFVGPKELPGMLRSFGKGIKKVRALAGDFQGQFNDALKEAELDGVQDTLKDLRNLDPTKQIKDKLNPLKSELEDIKNSLEDEEEFDPGSIFDDSEGPEIAEPEFADVDAALARQKKLDAKPAKKTVKKSAKSAAKKKPAVRKVASKKPTAKKTAKKKPASKSKLEKSKSGKSKSNQKAGA